MKDNNTVPIIAAIITVVASIVVAIINSNSMKEILNTEIIATQTAEARLTAVALSISSGYLPTFLPSEASAPTSISGIEPPIVTPDLLPTPQPTPLNNIFGKEIQLTPTAPTSSDFLTFRFHELGIVIFFFVIIGLLVFAIMKTEDGTLNLAAKF